ncbi:hypothetical protein FQ377_13720 [Arthrobacter echini]|uniref:Uncharacterized protein n=1 Tax=Arthrobacter echini TaxID=1529066 RepID=A0A5D0XK32_9MICC|nr:hypothetical protein [Arthrobacter echini]TYC96638.1 hypothetical protein FQ377_13720 [Arthrobacter echini]
MIFPTHQILMLTMLLVPGRQEVWSGMKLKVRRKILFDRRSSWFSCTNSPSPSFAPLQFSLLGSDDVPSTSRLP